MGFVFLAGTIVFTVFGQLIIKQQLDAAGDRAGEGRLLAFVLEFIFTRPLVIVGFASALLAAMCWVATLTRFELSFAYPFMALNFVVVTLVGAIAFSEAVNAYKLVGLLVVCSGLIVVALGS